MLGGPVLLFDAKRVARRMRLTLLRSLYALLLLVVLFLVHADWFRQDLRTAFEHLLDEQRIAPNDQARFATAFFHAFLAVQLGVVFVVTPVFTAGAIAEEREKGTLPLLLCTELTPHEILMGKLASRIGLLVLLLLAGLPVLAILQLLGGVDPVLLVAGFSNTFLTVISNAAACMYCSAGAQRTRHALWPAYSILLGLDLVSVLFFVMGVIFPPKGEELSALVIFQFLWHGLWTLVFLLVAGDRLRRSDLGLRDVNNPADRHETHRVAVPARPAMNDQPLLWKEAQVERGLFGGMIDRYDHLAFVSLGISLALPGVVLIGVLFDSPQEREGLALAYGWVLCPFVAALLLFQLSLRGAVALGRERDRQTLESLLTTDLTNGEILAQKWLGCWLSQRGLSVALGLLLLAWLIVAAGRWWAVPLLTVGVVAQLVFALNLGMYCSLVCRSTARAVAFTLAGVLGVGLGHWVLSPMTSLLARQAGWPEPVRQTLSSLHSHGLTPLVNMPLLGSASSPNGPLLLGAILGTTIYALLALLLWWRLQARFGPVTGRLR